MLVPAIQSEINWKLYCLVNSAYSGALAPAERPRDVEAKVGGQKPIEAKIRRSKIRKSKKSGLESKSGGPRLMESGPELEDK